MYTNSTLQHLSIQYFLKILFVRNSMTRYNKFQKIHLCHNHDGREQSHCREVAALLRYTDKSWSLQLRILDFVKHTRILIDLYLYFGKPSDARCATRRYRQTLGRYQNDCFLGYIG